MMTELPEGQVMTLYSYVNLDWMSSAVHCTNVGEHFESMSCNHKDTVLHNQMLTFLSLHYQGIQSKEITTILSVQEIMKPQRIKQVL